MNARPLASLSLDLDNRWSYLKTHGDAGWDRYPTYLPVLVPVVLEALARHELRCTFMVVGRDTERTRNCQALRVLVAHGHELGNHSYDHEPWMQDRPVEEVEAELRRAHEAICAAAGVAPKGFRGPGFAHSEALLQAVQRLGYSYDASILPSFIGPLARLYYLTRSGMSRAERSERRNLFGRVSDAWKPLAPFTWKWPDGGELLEVPVTTMPLLRAPFHLSYLVWLSRFSPTLALAYFELALGLCRLTRTEPSFLLHPLDFLGAEDAPDLSFFPGMDVPRAKKLAFVDRVLARLARRYEVLPMSEYTARVRQRPALRSRPVTPAAPAPTAQVRL